MEVTPEKPVMDSSRGSRHTPTPQMSERKRSLFGRCNTANMCLTVDEDSDLGPMSPIRYSPVEEEALANGRDPSMRVFFPVANLSWFFRRTKVHFS